MVNPRAFSLLLYCFFLIALQVATALAIGKGWDWGTVPSNAFIGLFIGLNVPIMLCSPTRGRGQNRRNEWAGVWSGGRIVLMLLVAANFMRAGAFAGSWSHLQGLLHILSAQSLWIALPSYWLASAPRQPDRL